MKFWGYWSSQALFTADSSGKGQANALNQDGSDNNAADPAAKDSIPVLFLTVEGETTPDGVDGRIARAASSVAGLMQINVKIPEGVTEGVVPITVNTRGVESPAGVTVAVR